MNLTANGVLDVDLYTTGQDVVMNGPAWSAVAASVQDVTTSWTVEATDSSGALLWTSPPSTLTIASDTIDDSAIYAWECSTQAFHVLDMTQGTDKLLQPYTNSPWLGAGQPCSGCHRVSRDGTRFSFTYDGNLVPDGAQIGDSYYYFDALSYDPSSQTFSQNLRTHDGRGRRRAHDVVPRDVRGLQSAREVAGAGGARHPSRRVGAPELGRDRRPRATRSRHERDGAEQPVRDARPARPSHPGRGTLLPDWSPDGSFVVFTVYDNTTNFVRNLGDDTVLGSIVEAPVSYANGAFTFGTPRCSSRPIRRTTPTRARTTSSQPSRPTAPRSPSRARQGGGASRRSSRPSTRADKSSWCAGATANCRARERLEWRGDDPVEHVAGVGSDGRAQVRMARVRLRATLRTRAHPG